MNPLLRLLVGLAVALAAACSRPAPRLDGELQRREPWPAQFVADFGTLPLQHDGRTMPFSTLAAATLYAVHGRRDVQFVVSDAGVDRKVKLSPTEWLLDVWCFPAQAARYPLFRIENVAVLSALGFEHSGQTQGFEYLTYAQLMTDVGESTVAQKLQQLAREHAGKAATARSPVESHLVHLFEQLVAYATLHRQLEMLQGSMPIEGEQLRAVFGGAERATISQALGFVAPLREFSRRFGEKLDDPAAGNLADVLSVIFEAMKPRGGPLLLPPTLPAEQADTWHALSEVVDGAMRGAAEPSHVAMIGHLQAGLLAADLGEAVRHLDTYRRQVEAATAARGEIGKIALESYYYGANWHFHAMMTFVLGFLVAVGACVLPRSRLLWWGAMLATVAAVGMLTADMWIRCLITGHPPIGRLYDTFLFIGGVGALTAVIAEWVLPRRIALVLAPLAGALLIMLARLFEVAHGEDTMRPLQAVLLSNFWLGIHVPTMNVGYAAALVASLLGCAWVVVRAGRIDHPDSPLAKSLVRMTYGVTCFSLATSVVGTILGGVWANDSWGRFWGWDPKENGALLICLSQIALLHARMSGMVRDAGFVLWSIVTGMVVVFSWFHTNLLGVGLHAYGFSTELLTGVWTSYSVLGLFLIGGAIDVWLRPRPEPVQPAARGVQPARV